MSGAHGDAGFAVAVGAGHVIQGVRTPRRRCRPSNAFRDLCVPHAHTRRNQDERCPCPATRRRLPEEDAADKVFEQLKQAKKEKLIPHPGCRGHQARRGQQDPYQRAEGLEGGQGRGVGAVIGAALGIITGPGVVLTTAAGAAIGGLAAQLRDAGFPDDQLKQVGEALKPGTSAIVAIIEHTWVADLEQEMQAQGAQVMRRRSLRTSRNSSKPGAMSPTPLSPPRASHQCSASPLARTTRRSIARRSRRMA